MKIEIAEVRFAGRRRHLLTLRGLLVLAALSRILPVSTAPTHHLNFSTYDF